MKNLMGIDIPIDTPEERKKFYTEQEPDECWDWLKMRQNHDVGKDEIFWDVLCPWLEEKHFYTALDVGARFGKYSMEMTHVISYVSAIDIAPQHVKNMKKALEEYENIIPLERDIENDPLTKKEDYDFIFASDILEHMVKPYDVWNNWISHSKYVYTLIPKGKSWNNSPDHVTEWYLTPEISHLIHLSYGLEWLYNPFNDEKNSWWALLVKGKLWSDS